MKLAYVVGHTRGYKGHILGYQDDHTWGYKIMDSIQLTAMELARA